MSPVKTPKSQPGTVLLQTLPLSFQDGMLRQLCQEVHLITVDASGVWDHLPECLPNTTQDIKPALNPSSK